MLIKHNWFVLSPFHHVATMAPWIVPNSQYLSHFKYFILRFPCTFSGQYNCGIETSCRWKRKSLLTVLVHAHLKTLLKSASLTLVPMCFVHWTDSCSRLASVNKLQWRAIHKIVKMHVRKCEDSETRDSKSLRQITDYLFESNKVLIQLKCVYL